MRKAGGGRNTLASYPECHSSWQRQPASAASRCWFAATPSFQWDLCLTMMVLRPGALCQLTSYGPLCRLSRQQRKKW